MQNIEENLKKLNVVLPEPASPVATYVPYNIVDNLLFILLPKTFKKLYLF